MQSNKIKKLQNDFTNHKLSHAYLIETNNYDECLNDIKELVKNICCNDSFSFECNKCNICNLIDKDEFPNFIIVKPEGKNIKKEQIINLKNKLSFMPVLTKNNVYVIVEAEKLNAHSSNTMLKMIEDPLDNVYGFFLTNNKENVLTTIQSRCEIIKNTYQNNNNLSMFDNDLEMFNKYVELAYDYLYHVEVEKKYSIMYNKTILLKSISERSEIELFFKLLFEIYNDAFNRMLGLAENNAYEKFDFLQKKDINTIKKEIILISECINDVKYNFNIELFLDKFVIEIGEING